MNTTSCFYRIPVVDFFATAKLLSERGLGGSNLLSMIWPKDDQPHGGRIYNFCRKDLHTLEQVTAWDIVLKQLDIPQNERGTTRVIFIVNS